MFVYIIRFVDTCTHMWLVMNSLSAKAEFIDMALNAISFLVYLALEKSPLAWKKLMKKIKSSQLILYIQPNVLSFCVGIVCSGRVL